VIVPAYLSHGTIRESLESLWRQSFRDFELIVVDSSPDDRSEKLVRTEFPQTRYYRTAERLFPHEGRNQGVEKARGRILVFTDPDCVAEPDWLERLTAYHADGPVVVGGAIRSLPGWWNGAVQAAKYPWWLPEAKAGPRSEVPSGNCSMSREVWDTVQGFRGEYFAGDSEICWRIRAAGYPIWFEPRAVVTHLEHPPLVPFARERFRRGRDFGRMRVRERRWSRARCLAYLLGAPLIPGVMTWRSARCAVRGKYMRRWLSTFPVQVLGNSLWSAGEALVHGAALWKR
jgi:glycosyltransferase involved in cell wall biosynthesis